MRRLSGSVSAVKRRMLEQDRGESASLLVVLDRERDLGLLRVRHAVVARDGDDVVSELGDERHPVLVVDVGEVVELRAGRRGDRREEPEVDRFARQPGEESEQAVVVGGADGSQVDGPAVGEDDVGLPDGRVLLLHQRPRVASRRGPDAFSCGGHAARAGRAARDSADRSHRS
jgi:hypothetical protein